MGCCRPHALDGGESTCARDCPIFEHRSPAPPETIAQPERNEAGRQEVEEAYRILVESSQQGLLLIQQGHIVFANRMAAQLTGYTVPELLANSLEQIITVIHPEDRAMVRQRHEDRLRGLPSPPRYEFRVIRQDGALRWLELQAGVVAYQGGPAVQIGLLDVTERKRAEEALRESQAKLQSIFDSSATLVEIQHDLAVRLGSVGDLEEGLGLCLQAALDASGLDCGGIYLRDEASGSLSLRCHTGLSNAFVARVSHFTREAAHTQLVMGGRPLYRTFERCGGPLDETMVREGLRTIAVIPIIYRNQVIGCLNVASHSLADVPRYSRSVLETIASQIGGTITRLQAEHSLRENEQRFRTLFEAAPDAIYLTDLEGRLVDANQTAEQLAGIPKKELVGKNLLTAGLLPRRQISHARAGLKRNAEGKAAGPDHFTLIRRDGARLMLEVKTFPLRFASGTVVLGVARDVTERQRAEEELRTHRHRLRALASELTLAEERERRRIALDLHDHACQDLVLAKMNVQSLLASASSAGDSELRQIDGTLEHILENVRELTFDLGSPTLYKFGLAAALEELLEDKLGAEPDLEYELWDDHSPKPLTEEVQVLLFRSIRELLINVLKHARAHQVILDIRRVGNSIRIAVTDDGIGFDTDKVLSLPTHHHGFGLFSIRERLDCIGGRLRIGSQRGLGSRFILMAPLKREGPNSGRKHDVSQDFVGG